MASKTPEWALYSLSYEELTHKKQDHLLGSYANCILIQIMNFKLGSAE